MDVRLEDGTVVKNVPEGITQRELMRRLGRGGTPPSQEWMNRTAASMTLADQPWYTRAAIQAGAGVDTLRQGIQQLLGGTTDESRREVARSREVKQALAQASDTGTLPSWMPTGGSALQFAGEAAPLMAVPVGAYTGAAMALPRAVQMMRGGQVAARVPARLGTAGAVGEGALAGGVAGALNPLANDESRLNNVLMGAAASSVLPGAAVAGRGVYSMVTPGGGAGRAGQQIAAGLGEGAADEAAVLRQTIDRLRAQPPSQRGAIPLSAAAQLSDPQLARLEAGSRARSGANWYDFDQAQARAVADELMGATGGATQIGQRKALRESNYQTMLNQAMGSINEPAFARNLSDFRAGLDTAMRSAESSNPAVRGMLTTIADEIDRLGPDFRPENLATIRANLAEKPPMIPQNNYQAAPRNSAATISTINRIDDLLNNATNNRWQGAVSAYRRDSDIVRSSQAASKVRGAFVDPETGRVRGVAADVGGDVPKITEAGLGRAMDVARGPRGEIVLDPAAAARLGNVLGALRQQGIVQSVKRSATAGGGSNTASDLMAARTAGQVGDVVAGMAGGPAGSGAKMVIDRALDFANTYRDRALAEALQDPQQLLRVLERRLQANQPLSTAEAGVLQILRGAPAAAVTQ
jgi:hypothetical protein